MGDIDQPPNSAANDRRAGARLSSIAEVAAEDWDACAGPQPNPFTSHAFLAALEESGSAAAETEIGRAAGRESV